MKRYVGYVVSGEIVCAGVTVADELPSSMEGLVFVEAPKEVDGSTHWYDAGAEQFVEYTQNQREAKRANPGLGFEWSPAAGQWVDYRPLEAVRAATLAKLRDKRDALLYGGLTWDGSTFDSDAEVSQPRLLGAFTTVIAGGWPAEGVAWRLKNNSWRTLSATDVQSLWAAFQFRMTALFEAFATHEAAVNAEQDAATLRSYDTEAGWP